MNRLLLVLMLLLAGQSGHAQPAPSLQYGYGHSLGTLWLKKRYHKKVRTWQEGDRIMLQTTNDSVFSGLITLLLNDTIYINGKRVARTDVRYVLLNPKRMQRMQISAGNLLLITGGVALVTGGLTLSNQASFREALVAGTVIGYGPIVLNYLGSKIHLRRRKFRIGQTFRLSMLDLHIPRVPAPRPF